LILEADFALEVVTLALEVEALGLESEGLGLFLLPVGAATAGSPPA
jgi:hypothetical protein